MQRRKAANQATILSSLASWTAFSVLASTPMTVIAAGDVRFRLFPDLKCSAETALTCWVGKVFQFSQTAILLLATAVIVMAGVIYMTSAGNPKSIEMSKKLILGALSGVAVIVLGRFFLVSVVGIPWL